MSEREENFGAAMDFLARYDRLRGELDAERAALSRYRDAARGMDAAIARAVGDLNSDLAAERFRAGQLQAVLLDLISKWELGLVISDREWRHAKKVAEAKP